MLCEKLRNAVSKFVEEKHDYFIQWVFDEPIVASAGDRKELGKVQNLMFRMISGFVTEYLDKFQHVMPVTEKELRVIKAFDKKKIYRPGTYRTDFVFDSNRQIKLIEITCRFALNAIFENVVFNQYSIDYACKTNLQDNRVEEYLGAIDYLASLIADHKKVCILKGSDLKNSSRIFKGIFEDAGLQVIEVQWQDCRKSHELLSDSFVVSELTLEEITNLDDSTLSVLANCSLVNDFRTALLIHDKRFFSVLFDDGVLGEYLSQEEVMFFKPYLIPTYSYGQSPKVWDQARGCKDGWILKHRALGKSKSIYAGPVTDERKWSDLFDSHEIKDFILQQWVSQDRVSGHVGGVGYDDFITGTLMFFDEHYFGLGPFRTSSHPVTNVTDDRKAFPLVLEDPDQLDQNKYLLRLVRSS